MPRIGFTSDNDDYEYSDNTDEVIPLTVDQPSIPDIDEWQVDE